MKWFNNLKTSVKLLSGFILVAIIAGVVGVVGVLSITKTNTNYSSLYTDFGVAIGDMGEVSTNFQRARVNLRDILLDRGSTDRNKYVTKIEELDQKVLENLAMFEKSIQTEEARNEFLRLKAAIEKFGPIQQEIIRLGMSNQEDQALLLMRGDGAKTAAEINDSIEKLFKLKVSGGLSRSGEYTIETEMTVKMMITVILIGMLVAIVLGVLISRTISKPVNKLAAAAAMIADGDLNVTIDIDTKDEVGKLAASFRKMSENLNEVMSNITLAAEQVAAGSRQVSDSSMALSQGATEQASSIEELTASLEEISSQTRLNADNAGRANELAEDARTNAARGNAEMGEMLKAMDEINEASGSISKIIKVIDEIAFQTNILALNAAVEAARAGQHGKGFAVVAEEVRNLAARSANAAKETTAMIEGSIKKVEGGTRIAGQTADALNKIVEGIAKVANLIGDISMASNEQAAGISQINQGILQVSQVVQTNSATSEESAAASEELASQAEMLKHQVARFKLRNSKNQTVSSHHSHFDESHRETMPSGTKKIILSDREFGKY